MTPPLRDLDQKLRLQRPGVVVAAERVDFTFDGRRFDALRGDTVAAALAVQGVRALRQTQTGAWRGLYCGMGACFDCAVTIDGRIGQRACLYRLEGGEDVRSTPPAGNALDPLQPLTRRPTAGELPEQVCDLLVIGAGPAGLNAALAPAEAGANVVILDERPQAGGQYFKPVASTHRSTRPIDGQFARGTRLLERVHASGVRIQQEAQVWGAFAADHVLSLIKGQAMVYRPKALILATGAYERAMPIPGWTLPGVMTTGAMQTLARSYQVKPGARVLIAGNGPLNFQLAADLCRHGVEVVALAEAADRPGIRQLGALARACWSGLGDMASGANYLRILRARGVPVLWGHRAVSVQPHADELGVVLQGEAEASRLDADAVALGYGFVAATELAAALGCRLEFDSRSLGGFQVATDADGRTSLAGVFAVGDGATMGGAALAEIRGWNAGLAAARDLGLPCRARRRSCRRPGAFQTALWQLFASPRVDLADVPDETVLCRCEGIDFGTLRQQIAQGARSLGVLKRRLRLGMGPCQGRYCAMSASHLLQAAHGTEPAPFAPRLPVKPFPAAALMIEKPEWGGHRRAGSPNLARPLTAPPFGEIAAEVVIIGGGVVGACMAHECARLGLVTLVLDRDDVNLQASGANAGSLHVQLLSFDFGAKAEAGGGPAADTLPLGPWAIRLWQELAKACDDSFEIRITGGLMVAESAAGMRFLEAKAALERRHGLAAEIIGASELRAMAPNLSPELIGAEWSPMEGKINPLAATYAVMDRARSLGARFEPSTDVHAIERSGTRWQIETSRGSVSAARVVNAAGPWARQIGAMVGIELPVYSAPLQMIVTERAPPLVDQLVAHADRHLSLKQLASGGLVIGGAWTAAYSAHQNMNVTIRESIEGNLWVAGRVLPQLAGLHVLRSWAGMNVNIDGAPIIGEAPGRPGFFNAVTSNGYTLAPAVARLTAELLTGAEPAMNIEPYRLERFA